MSSRLIIFVLFISSQLTLLAQNFPDPMSPPRLVSDFGNMLELNEEEQLEKKLVAFDERSSTQIAVVTLNNLDGGEISSYAFQLAENWGIGQSGEDNGVLVLVAKEERQIFIATGYGLEDVIPDAIAKRIIERDILPLFRQGRVYDGLDLGTDQLIDLSDGKVFEDSSPQKNRDNSGWIVMLVIFGFIAFFIFLPFLFMYIGYKKSKYPKQGKSFWKYVADNSSSGSGGSSSGGGWSSSGSSGGWSSGSSSGSSGGFGGFGGGSFGGGGAGGSW